MMSLGVLLLAFLAYQLVFTNVLTAGAQRQAEEGFEERLSFAATQIEVADTLPAVTSTTLPDATPVATVPEQPEAILYAEPAPEEGEAFGKMQIPAIDLEWLVFEGVDRTTLKKGPGHMPWTPLPGQPGNAVISGHRTTYGAPFFDVDRLKPGDEIIIETALGRHVYEVREVFVVSPTDVWVTDPMRGAWLTLTTCNPKYSARERLIVQAELVEGPNYAYAEAQKVQFTEAAS